MGPDEPCAPCEVLGAEDGAGDCAGAAAAEEPEQTVVHVLLIDDSPVTLKQAKKTFEHALAQLKRSRYHLSLARTGEEGLEILRKVHEEQGEGARHVVVCDMLMPGMNGAGVLAAIKAQPALAAQTSVTMLTGMIDQELCESCLRDGANKIVYKPMTIRKAVQMLAQSDEYSAAADAQARRQNPRRRDPTYDPSPAPTESDLAAREMRREFTSTFMELGPAMLRVNSESWAIARSAPLLGCDATVVALNDFIGRKVLVAFFSALESAAHSAAGAHAQAWLLRLDRLAPACQAAGCEVLGVCADDVETVKAVQLRFGLDFKLVSDPELLVSKVFAGIELSARGAYVPASALVVVDAQGHVEAKYSFAAIDAGLSAADTALHGLAYATTKACLGEKIGALVASRFTLGRVRASRAQNEDEFLESAGVRGVAQYAAQRLHALLRGDDDAPEHEQQEIAAPLDEHDDARRASSPETTLASTHDAATAAAAAGRGEPDEDAGGVSLVQPEDILVSETELEPPPEGGLADFEAPRPRSKLVLVIDDDADARADLVLKLVWLGHTTVSGGREALSYLADFEDALELCLLAPGASGVRAPQTTVAVVLLTADTEPPDATAAAARGLPTPTPMNLLAAIVGQVPH